MCSPLPLAGENKFTSVHRQHDASPINVRTAILWQNTPHNAQLAWPHLSAPMSLPHNAQLAWPHLSAPMSLSTRLLQLRRASDTCPMLIADVLTLSYYRGGMLGFGIEPRWCYRSRRMATSSMPCSTRNSNPTAWKWNLDWSTTSDAPLNYLEDRKQSTASGNATR
jgi:hypothetical protein